MSRPPEGPTGRNQILERGRELDRVADLAAAAVAGRGRCLAVTGAPGIGKTALTSAAREAGRAMGMWVSVANGGLLERDHPFAAVRDLLEPLVLKTPVESRATLFAGAAGRAAHVIGMPKADFAGAGDEDPGAILHALYWLVANLAEQGPLLLITDDAHWLDGPSLRLLAYLAAHLDGLRVALLVACRPPEPGAEGDLLATLLADSAVELVQPAPLSSSAVTTLVRGRLGAEADAQFCQACVDSSGGNPFLTIELLRALQESHVEPTGASAAVVADIGARRAGKVILRRLFGLPDNARELARAVAVLGQDAELHVAAQLAGLAVVDAAQAVEFLSSLDLLASERPLRFSHPLVRAAVYDSLGSGARARAHGRAAHLLEAMGASAAHIAAHLLAADPAGDEWVVTVLLSAGQMALAQGAPDTAARFLGRALVEPPRRARRVEVLVALGLAERALNRPSGVDHLLEALALTSDPTDKIEIALALYRPLIALRRAHEAVLLLQALRSDTDDSALRLRLEAAIAASALMAADAPSSVGADIEALCQHMERGDDLPPSAAMVGTVVAALKNRPAAPLGRRAARTLSDHRMVPRAQLPLWCLSAQWTLIMCEHPDADEASDWLIERAQSQGEAFMLAGLMANRALSRLRRGDLNRAEADARIAAEIDVLCDARDSLAEAVAALVEILVQREDCASASELLVLHGLDGAIDPLPIGQEFIVRARALLRLAQGRTTEAIAELRAAGQGCISRLALSPAHLPWRSDLASALAAAGRLDEAVTLAREEAELARAFGAPTTLGNALRCLGALTNDEAVLQEAVQILGNAKADLGLGLALVELGALRRRRNASSDARALLARGLDLATRCGAKALATRARAEIGLAGGQARRSAVTGRESLTAAELRAATLAAGGCTNKEIAQSMFVSLKTIETQLGAAFRKLQITSRGELAHALSG